ncbi:unnamed protein product, partial [Mesorhabditis belari]
MYYRRTPIFHKFDLRFLNTRIQNTTAEPSFTDRFRLSVQSFMPSKPDSLMNRLRDSTQHFFSQQLIRATVFQHTFSRIFTQQMLNFT